MFMKKRKKKDGRERGREGIPAKDIRGHKNSLQLAAAGSYSREVTLLYR